MRAGRAGRGGRRWQAGLPALRTPDTQTRKRAAQRRATDAWRAWRQCSTTGLPGCAMLPGGANSVSLRAPVENSQIAPHAQGDAHGDLLLIAKGKHEVGPEEEFRPAETDFVPWNTQRRMADAERKKDGSVQCVASGGQANHAAVMGPQAHVNRVKKGPRSLRFSVWIGLPFEAPAKREPAALEADQEANSTNKNDAKEGNAQIANQRVIECAGWHGLRSLFPAFRPWLGGSLRGIEKKAQSFVHGCGVGKRSSDIGGQCHHHYIAREPLHIFPADSVGEVILRAHIVALLPSLRIPAHIVSSPAAQLSAH